MLGNNLKGYTWFGVNKKGKLTISYKNKKGFTDVLTVDTSDSVHLSKNNHLKFVQFPDGYFYVELNAYKIWSYDLPDASQKIPLIGFTNRIVFYSDINIKKLEINTLNSPWNKVNRRDPNCISGNCKDGIGTYLYANGHRYVGQFKKNPMDDLFEQLLFQKKSFRHGYGKYYNKKGRLVYEGYHKSDTRHGEGIYYWEDGEKYVGKFEKGKQHGRGAMYNSKGKKYNSGIYKLGKLEIPD